MGFATVSGPWLIGSVKETTGSTPGRVRNTGSAEVVQTRAIAFTNITAATLAFALPAGSIITTARFLTTVAYATTTPTIALFVNGVAINTASSITAFGGTGYADIALGNNSAAAAVLVGNVGATDAIITFTQANVTATSGAGVLVIKYVVRNSSGASFPATA